MSVQEPLPLVHPLFAFHPTHHQPHPPPASSFGGEMRCFMLSTNCVCVYLNAICVRCACACVALSTPLICLPFSVRACVRTLMRAMVYTIKPGNTGAEPAAAPAPCVFACMLGGRVGRLVYIVHTLAQIWHARTQLSYLPPAHILWRAFDMQHISNSTHLQDNVKVFIYLWKLRPWDTGATRSLHL